MLISQYIKDYTSGEPVGFVPGVSGEIAETLEAIWLRDRDAIREEWADVLHFLQLWLFWRFGMDSELWAWTMPSVRKFQARLVIWRKLYVAAGLDPMTSNFCGNNAKIEKVVKQLGTFGVPRDAAERAFREVMNAG